jgi:hypothetical protein
MSCPTSSPIGAEARRLARKDADGAWRSTAPFSIHGQPGEWIWDKSHKEPVRKSDQSQSGRVKRG